MPDLLKHNREFFFLRVGLTRVIPTAHLIARILVSDFRYDYCSSIPLATALGINIRVFGAKAVVALV